MPTFKKVKTFAYDSTSITSVISVQYDPIVNQLVPALDGGGVPEIYGVESDAQQGTVVFRDKAEAEKFASKHAASKNVTFKTEDSVDAAYTITLTGVKSGASQGTRFALAGAGPWTIQFACLSASEPVAD